MYNWHWFADTDRSSHVLNPRANHCLWCSKLVILYAAATSTPHDVSHSKDCLTLYYHALRPLLPYLWDMSATWLQGCQLSPSLSPGSFQLYYNNTDTTSGLCGANAPPSRSHINKLRCNILRKSQAYIDFYIWNYTNDEAAILRYLCDTR